MTIWTFVFEEGKVLTIRANSRKEAIEYIHEHWYKDICYNQNFTTYKSTGGNV